MEITNINKVWKYIRKESGKQRVMDENIGKEEWRRDFMGLLEGMKGRKESQTRKERGQRVMEDITREEVDEAINRLKKKKAPGEDGLKNEIWIHANEKGRERLTKILNQVWKGEGWPSG